MASISTGARPSSGASNGPIDRAGKGASPAASGLIQRITPALGRALLDAKLPTPVIIYLLTVVLPIGFKAGPLAMTTLRIFLLIMVLPLFKGLFSGRYGKLIATDFLLLAHLSWAAIALGVNSPGQAVQQVGSVGVEFIGGYLMGRAYIRTPENFVALCRWLVFLVLCTTPFALYETKTGNPLILMAIAKIPGITSVPNINIEGRLGLQRVQAVFAHPIHYGLFCSVAFSLAFVALRDMTSTGWRYLSSFLVVGSGFLALSSGAMLAMALQIALIAWSSIFARMTKKWWLLVGLFVLAYIVVALLSNRTPIQVFMSYATFSAHNAYYRGVIFEWGMKNVDANPIFGLGMRDWVRPQYMVSGSMDNFWLVMGVRYGIPGFALLAMGYAWLMFRIMRLNLAANQVLRQIRLAWVFTFLGLSFTLTTVHIWTNIYSFVFFMFGSGVWLIDAAAALNGDTGKGVAKAGATSGATAAAADPQPAERASARSLPRGDNRSLSQPYSRFAPTHHRTDLADKDPADKDPK